MLDRSSASKHSAPESYGRIVARPALVLATLLALAAWQFRPRPEPSTLPPSPPPPVVAKVVEPELPSPARPEGEAQADAEPRAAGTRAGPRRGRPGRGVARPGRPGAGQGRRPARRGREGVPGRHDPGRQRPGREPGARRARSATPARGSPPVVAKGGFLRGERDKLKTELAALERVPQPKAKALMAKNAVAKPTDGTEYHFEIRGDRVAFIDIDRLIEMVKTDARIRLRSGGQRGRLGATVGPVGSFSLRYELGRSLPEALAEIVDSRESSYNLLGWEIVPEGNNRGETYESTHAPSSTYARAINRLSPGRDTITMWIYPDGFALYRRLRDDLHARGFLVAARPLPDGTAIRGSPVGSVSAGQ